MANPPIDLLEECFDVDFVAGRLFWKERPSSHFASEQGMRAFNSKFPGKEAFASRNEHACSSRVTIQCVRFSLLRARIIWALKHGRWPAAEIDHCNDDTFDDRIDNLREQTVSQHNAHRRLTKSKVKAIGVNPIQGGRFIAGITEAGKRKYLGSFDTIEEAKAAYDAEAVRIHGAFARVAEPVMAGGK